jgi:hypothetical protein
MKKLVPKGTVWTGHTAVVCSRFRRRGWGWSNLQPSDPVPILDRSFGSMSYLPVNACRPSKYQNGHIKYCRNNENPNGPLDDYEFGHSFINGMSSLPTLLFPLDSELNRRGERHSGVEAGFHFPAAALGLELVGHRIDAGHFERARDRGSDGGDLIAQIRNRLKNSFNSAFYKLAIYKSRTRNHETVTTTE